MNNKTEFGNSFRRYISDEGEPVRKLPDFASNPRNLVPLYRSILTTRTFDEKAVALQRTGRLGTYPSSLGQEAVGVGVAAAMQVKDVLLPSFREQSAMLLRGVSMTELLLYWGGDETGNDFAKPRKDFPICVPVGSHFSHAAGVGFALKNTGTDAAAVAIAGDGATSKGDFYEAINIAGVWRLPVIFVIANNQWAISVPRSRQTAAATLAQKASAAGIQGFQVDGNDVVAVKQLMLEVLDRARKSHTSAVIEAVTYRLSDHTTADDASRYRSDAEVSEHWKYDPVKRLRSYLQRFAGWSGSEEETLQSEISEQVNLSVEEYLATPAQPTESSFDYLYESLPPALAEQRNRLIQAGKSDA